VADVNPGPIVLPSDVEIAVRDVMQEWVPYYLGDIDEQSGRERGETAPPRTWDVASENDRWLEETPPALLVVCPGTVDEPDLHGKTGSYGAWWQVNIGVTAGGATEVGSRGLAGRHAGAVLYVLAQQRDMGGLAADVRWRGLRTDVVDRRRKLAACEVLAHVRIARVVDTRGRLPHTVPNPKTDPHSPDPDVSGTRVRVRPVIR
jgi:hypothetical protein